MIPSTKELLELASDIRMMPIFSEKVLEDYAHDTENGNKNFALARQYENVGQIASAIGLYLRCAELTNDNNLAYESLLRMGLCYIELGNTDSNSKDYEQKTGRDAHVEIAYQNAISLLPDRPEAYQLMSMFFELKQDWHQVYTWARMGLTKTNFVSVPLQTNINYFGKQSLLLQEAASLWWVGRFDESRIKYNNLILMPNLSDNVRTYTQESLEFLYSSYDKIELVESIDEHITNLENFNTKFRKQNLTMHEVSTTTHLFKNYYNGESAEFNLYKNCQVSDCIRKNQHWEEYHHNLIDNYITKDSVVVEAGSHIGSATVKLSKVAKKVYAFEPFKSSYDLLTKNLELNHCKNVKTYQKALSNKNEVGYLGFTGRENPGGTGLIGEELGKPNDTSCEFYEETDENKIDLITLDSLKLNKLDYIKVDVEGYEKYVILGGLKTIKKCKPILVIEAKGNMKDWKSITETQIEIRFKELIDMGYTYKHVEEDDYIFFPNNMEEH